MILLAEEVTAVVNIVEIILVTILDICFISCCHKTKRMPSKISFRKRLELTIIFQCVVRIFKDYRNEIRGAVCNNNCCCWEDIEAVGDNKSVDSLNYFTMASLVDITNC